MTVGNAIKEMIHQCRTTQKGLAEKAGYKTLSCVTTPISRDEIKVSTLLRFADVLGYDLYLVKRANVEGYNPIRIDPKPETKPETKKEDKEA